MKSDIAHARERFQDLIKTLDSKTASSNAADRIELERIAGNAHDIRRQVESLLKTIRGFRENPLEIDFNRRY
jgi:hypothetical protein